MSNLPPDPYDRTKIVEPTLDAPDRAALQGTGRDFVVSLSTNAEIPGASSMFLSRTGQWVPFGSTDLSSWGSIVGDINEQADLMAQLALKANAAGISAVGYSGQYNDLLNKPVLGDLAFINTNGQTSYFLRGDGTWQIPTDVYATWGQISGDMTAQTDLMAALNGKAPLVNPTFTGTVTVPTPPVDDSTTKAATTAWFFGQAFDGVPIMDGVASSGDSKRWARGNHRHPSDTSRAPLDTPAFTGNPSAPSPPQADNSQRLATTEFVKTAIAGFSSDSYPVGGGTDKVFLENDQVVTTSYTLRAGKHAGTFGPITVNNGVSVTIPNGAVWTVV